MLNRYVGKFSNCRKMSPGPPSALECWDLISICGRGLQNVTMHWVFLDIGWILSAIAAAGAGYTLLAVVLVGRFMQSRQNASGDSPAFTILKPLHRGEPDLSRNLETFFAQNYAGQVQIVFGVHDQSDPAVAVVHAL